jgi:hypothetical protein
VRADQRRASESAQLDEFADIRGEVRECVAGCRRRCAQAGPVHGDEPHPERCHGWCADARVAAERCARAQQHRCSSGWAPFGPRQPSSIGQRAVPQPFGGVEAPLHARLLARVDTVGIQDGPDVAPDGRIPGTWQSPPVPSTVVPRAAARAGAGLRTAVARSTIEDEGRDPGADVVCRALAETKLCGDPVPVAHRRSAAVGRQCPAQDSPWRDPDATGR